MLSVCSAADLQCVVWMQCRGMWSVFVATVTPLPMCADPHHLSMRWMVLSPGGDERQTTDEDAGHLVSCASLVVWEVESGGRDTTGISRQMRMVVSCGVGGGEWRQGY